MTTSTDSISLHNDNMIIDQSNINDKPIDKHTEEENKKQFSDHFNLRDSVIRMIIRLQSKGSITGSIISEILDEYAEITNGLCRSLQRKLRRFMESRQMLDSDVSDLLESFKVNKSFEGLRTVEQQMEALKSSTEYIESKEILLGTRINNIIDRKTGTFVTKIVETC